MKAVLIKTTGEVSVISTDASTSDARLRWMYDAIGCSLIQYLPHYGEENPELDLIADEEGLLAPEPKPNALATLLAGYHTIGQHIVGDVLVVSTKDAPEGADWGDDPDLEVKVLTSIQHRLKEAMLV